MIFKKLREKLLKLVDKTTGYDKAILLKTFRLPNGLIETFFIDQGKDSVQVFAMTSQQEVICVKQFRAGTESEEIELPGGSVDEGEEILTAAKRELEEETGYVGEVTYLCSIPYSPYSTGKRHLFMATGCKKKSSQNLDPNEFLSLKLFQFSVFREMMQKGALRGFENAYLALDHLGLL